MQRGLRYRFYPTPEQKIALAKTFGCVRYVYNWALALRSRAWDEHQESIGYLETSRRLTQLKRDPDTIWLTEVSKVPIQQSLRHLQTAFVNFWKNRAEYPTFKRRDHQQSAEFTRSGFQWRDRQLTLTKIGRLKIHWSRQFTATPTTVTVSKTAAGRYYVSFRVDEPLPAMPKAVGEIGIDLGLTSFAVLSTGEKVQSPRPLRRKMARLKRAHKALSRKRKGSKNRDKARIRVARLYEKIGNTRRDFLHKLSTRIIRENQTVAVEDLNVVGMLANHRLAEGISDSGWAEFVRQLRYKCEWYGRKLIRVERFFPSSKRCSECGKVVHTLPLDIRFWTCPACGVSHDRDTNAARNILAEGHSVIARGDDVRPKRRRARRRGCLGSGNRPVACA